MRTPRKDIRERIVRLWNEGDLTQAAIADRLRASTTTVGMAIREALTDGCSTRPTKAPPTKACLRRTAGK